MYTKNGGCPLIRACTLIRSNTVHYSQAHTYIVDLNWHSTRVLTQCINSSRPTWFIIHTKRSDTCSRFLEITYQSYSISANEPKAAGGNLVLVRLGLITNQIILYSFAHAIYDEIDANAMVTDRIITTHSFRHLWLCLIIIVILARLKSTHTLTLSVHSGLNTNHQQRRNNGEIAAE